jgi:hypothetical protein
MILKTLEQEITEKTTKKKLKLTTIYFFEKFFDLKLLI